MGQLHTALITAAQHGRLIAVAAVPNGPDSVDHVLRWQLVATADFGIAGGAAVQCSAFGHQLGTGCTVNGTINSATTQKGIVGGVDDCIHSQCRDVVCKNVNFCQIPSLCRLFLM